MAQSIVIISNKGIPGLRGTQWYLTDVDPDDTGDNWPEGAEEGDFAVKLPELHLWRLERV